MQINSKKTKVMIFNTQRKYVFLPKLHIDDKVLEVVEEFKLLGIVITSDLKWNSNTKNRTSRAYSKLWLLRRLKRLGTPVPELVDSYFKQVRSILELAVPVWNPGLTVANSNSLERVQKSALAVILGKNYTSYNNALKTLELETLKERRESICLKFGLKSRQNPNFKNWFQDNPGAVNGVKTRNVVNFRPVWTQTRRYGKSPLPYLTELMNNHYHAKNK